MQSHSDTNYIVDDALTSSNDLANTLLLLQQKFTYNPSFKKQIEVQVPVNLNKEDVLSTFGLLVDIKFIKNNNYALNTHFYTRLCLDIVFNVFLNFMLISEKIKNINCYFINKRKYNIPNINIIFKPKPLRVFDAKQLIRESERVNSNIKYDNCINGECLDYDCRHISDCSFYFFPSHNLCFSDFIRNIISDNNYESYYFDIDYSMVTNKYQHYNIKLLGQRLSLNDGVYTLLPLDGTIGYNSPLSDSLKFSDLDYVVVKDNHGNRRFLAIEDILRRDGIVLRRLFILDEYKTQNLLKTTKTIAEPMIIIKYKKLLRNISKMTSFNLANISSIFGETDEVCYTRNFYLTAISALARIPVKNNSEYFSRALAVLSTSNVAVILNGKTHKNYERPGSDVQRLLPLVLHNYLQRVYAEVAVERELTTLLRLEDKPVINVLNNIDTSITNFLKKNSTLYTVLLTNVQSATDSLIKFLSRGTLHAGNGNTPGFVGELDHTDVLTDLPALQMQIVSGIKVTDLSTYYQPEFNIRPTNKYLDTKQLNKLFNEMKKELKLGDNITTDNLSDHIDETQSINSKSEVTENLNSNSSAINDETIEQPSLLQENLSYHETASDDIQSPVQQLTNI